MDEQTDTEKELPEGYDVLLESGQPEDEGMPSPETETELGAPEPEVDSEDTPVYAKETGAVEPEKMPPEVTPVAQIASNKSDIKKYFLYVLIGGLVASALISIVAVLIGEFNDFMGKSLFTTLLIVIHSLIVLAFVSTGSERRDGRVEIIVNVLFAITIASFFTSVFAVWEVLTGSIIGNLYLMYFYAFVGALLIRALLGAGRVDSIASIFADISIYLTIFLFFLLMPSVFVEYPVELPDFYYRGVAASGILLGTTTILTAIFLRLYVSKHPEQNQEKNKPFSVGKWILLAFVLLVIVYIAFGILRNLMYTMR